MEKPCQKLSGADVARCVEELERDHRLGFITKVFVRFFFSPTVCSKHTYITCITVEPVK